MVNSLTMAVYLVSTQGVEQPLPWVRRQKYRLHQRTELLAKQIHHQSNNKCRTYSRDTAAVWLSSRMEGLLLRNR